MPRLSGRQFLVFRPLRGGFRAPVSARHFPISISAGRRPVRLPTETGSQSALGGLVGADASAIAAEPDVVDPSPGAYIRRKIYRGNGPRVDQDRVAGSAKKIKGA